MNSIPEVRARLFPVLETAMNCLSRNLQLDPLRETIFLLQMATYWLRSAEQDLQQEEDPRDIITSTGGVPLLVSRAPTLLGVQDHLGFIDTKLKELTKELEDYSLNTPMPQRVIHKIEKGMDKLTEALFTTELASTYYERIPKGRPE